MRSSWYGFALVSYRRRVPPHSITRRIDTLFFSSFVSQRLTVCPCMIADTIDDVKDAFVRATHTNVLETQDQTENFQTVIPYIEQRTCKSCKIWTTESCGSFVYIGTSLALTTMSRAIKPATHVRNINTGLICENTSRPSVEKYHKCSRTVDCDKPLLCPPPDRDLAEHVNSAENSSGRGLQPHTENILLF